MKPIAQSVTIRAPLDEVFRVCSDIPNAEQLISAITQIEIVSGHDVGVGTRWRETRKMFGKEHTEEMWITEFDPPHRYAVEAANCGAKYFTDFEFEAIDDNQTKVTIRFRAEAETLMAKMMSPVMKMMAGSLLKALTQDLDDIRQRFEDSSPSLSSETT